MANVRAVMSHEGVHRKTEKFKIDDSTITYDRTKEGNSAQVGLAVTLSANDTIALTADADFVLGKLLLVEEDGFATVQIGGYADLPAGDGATVTAGQPVVGDLGAASAKGYIRNVNSAQAAELAKANGRIHDAATSTAVWVYLG